MGTRTADDDGNVIRRTSGSAERLHLAHEERHECSGVENGLRLLIEVGFVGRTAAFGHAEEAVFVAVGGFDVDLSGQVAARVHLVIHVERGILRVAEVFLGVGFVNTEGNGLFVFKARPHLLSLFAVDDGRAGVLADGELTFGRHLRVAQEGERHILVVVGGFGIGENFGHLLVVLAAEEEGYIAEGLIDHSGDAFALHLEDGLAFKLAHADVVFGE